MNSNIEPRLVELQEVPRPIANSLYLALSIEGGQTHLSYHKNVVTPIDVDGLIDISKISLLNFSERASCVSLRFGRSLSTVIDEWNGDKGSGHSLTALGLRSNRIYEVLNSHWLRCLEATSGQEWVSDRNVGLRHFVCAFRMNVVQVAALSLQYFEGDAPLQAASTSLLRPKSVLPPEV
jgi:hypothetical protein